jgi:hypothetical protein
MRLAQDDEVIDTLPPDRADHSFGTTILPRRGWCSWLIPDAHSAQSAFCDGAVDPIPIANEIFPGIVPRKCLRYLTRNPFRRRVCRGVDPDEISAVSPNDDQGIDQTEPDSRDNEQVHSGDVRCEALSHLVGNEPERACWRGPISARGISYLARRRDPG